MLCNKDGLLAQRSIGRAPTSDDLAKVAVTLWRRTSRFGEPWKMPMLRSERLAADLMTMMNKDSHDSTSNESTFAVIAPIMA